MTAASVLTVIATIVRITAATVAPIWGIRSSRPVIRPSTTGNGIPSSQQVTPAIVPATIEIAMLPSSDADTALIESSTTGRQRLSVFGGPNPNSHSVIVGRSMSKNSDRNVSVTSDSAEENAFAAIPNSV